MFSSKQKKYQKNYNYLVEVLKASNIDSREKVHEQLKSVYIKVTFFSVLVLVVFALLIFFLPEYYSILLVFGVLVFMWGCSSAYNAVKIMRQYVRDEL